MDTGPGGQTERLSDDGKAKERCIPDAPDRTANRPPEAPHLACLSASQDGRV
ncbi:MAG: hypothetical protein SO142_02680 [Prevotella sp.]|nr:hypothetical protein [Prevotella sp.]